MRRMALRRVVGIVATALAFSVAAEAAAPMSNSIPPESALCRSAILLAERATRVPDRLLNAIATVESGRRDPVSGMVYPWPWVINVEGVGHFYDTKADAVAAVRGFQAQGSRSIDVGCMQVNLMYHPDAFTSLEQAFDPVPNAAYAARFLNQLFAQTYAWPRAVAAYHSWTPEVGADYARRVLTAWGVPQPPPAALDAEAIGALAQATPRSGTYTASSGGRVAVMMPAGSNGIRVMTLASNSGAGNRSAGGPGAGSLGAGNSGAGQATAPAGRGLDLYRATPILAAGRFVQVYSPGGMHPTGF